jgi:hypothetical protein
MPKKGSSKKNIKNDILMIELHQMKIMKMIKQLDF